MRYETRHVVDDTIDMDSLTTSLEEHLNRIRAEGGRVISVMPSHANQMNEHQHYTVVVEFDT